MRYAEYPPDPSTASCVHCYWTLDGPGQARETPEPALPDGRPELILNLGDPWVARGVDGTDIEQPPIMLVGQITRPMVVRPSGTMRLVAARLAPYGAAYFQRPVKAYTDTWIDLTERDPLARARSELVSAGEGPDRVRVLASAISEIVSDAEPTDPRTVRAVAEIDSSHGGVSVDRLADATDLSERQLLRRFAEDVGISPKQLCRIRRFQRVFAAWREQTGSWASVAVQCGYFDQSHLMRDFAAFAGGAPAGMVARMSEFTKAFTALGAGGAA